MPKFRVTACFTVWEYKTTIVEADDAKKAGEKVLSEDFSGGWLFEDEDSGGAEVLYCTPIEDHDTALEEGTRYERAFGDGSDLS